LLLGLGAAQEIEKGTGVQKCPGCGFSQADFKKTGRLGCPQCYETFADALGTLIKQMHKGTEHTGKVPQRLVRTLERESHLKELQRNLRKAVASEDFESAATLRDKIREFDVPK